MDPKKSLLDLPELALVKILADEKLRVKDRKRLMQTCHQLHCMTSPKNLLEATIPLNLFRNATWPLCTLKTAIKSGNLECCLYIFDRQQTNLEKLKKTFVYKIARDKYFYKNRFYFLHRQGIQMRIPPSSYSFVFYTPDVSYSDESPRNAADLIPLFTDKKSLIELFKRCGYPEIAQNYAQAKNSKELQSSKILAARDGIAYPPNILGHACVFGDVQLLKEIVSSCCTIDELSMYSPYPASVLALAAEYHHPECFKLLYETPWLKNYFNLFCDFSYDYRPRYLYNHLEAFIFYFHDKKMIETLLKTGCFTINKSMHYICVKRDGKEYCASNKIPPGKTLLDILLQEKNRKKKKYIQTREYHQLDSDYCEDIVQLLRKHGGKTAQEIAAIHPFNEYMIEDIQKNIIYRLPLIDQHKNRLVCSLWKKVIDDNPPMATSDWGLKLLRNPKPAHSFFRNALRVLLSAIYKKDHYLTEAIFQSFQQHKIVCNTYYMNHINDDLNDYNFVYDIDDFIQSSTTLELIKKYERRSYVQSFNDITFLPLIAASLSNDIQQLQKTLTFFKEKTDYDNAFFQTALQQACLILADYDYHEGISVVVNIFKDKPFFTRFFNDLVCATHALESPGVLEVLLSSGIDINQINNQKTLKDKILKQNKIQSNKQYVIYVNVLLNIYGAKTYREMKKDL